MRKGWIEISDLVVLRFVNFFYYLCFLIYTLIIGTFLVKNRKREPYNTAFRIFLATSIVLLIMEYGGTLAGIRVFYISSEQNLAWQMSLQIIMAFGEGGAATAIMYLMVNEIYNKNVKKYLAYLLSLSVLMFIFASSTFFYTRIS